MNYGDIPEYDRIESWLNANDKLEMKLLKEHNAGDTVEMHLVEDDRDLDRIEDQTFYTWRGVNKSLEWVRERKGIEMPGGIVDADYVLFKEDGTKVEQQHNHRHLDNDVELGRRVPLRVHTA